MKPAIAAVNDRITSRIVFIITLKPLNKCEHVIVQGDLGL